MEKALPSIPSVALKTQRVKWFWFSSTFSSHMFELVYWLKAAALNPAAETLVLMGNMAFTVFFNTVKKTHDRLLSGHTLHS